MSVRTNFRIPLPESSQQLPQHPVEIRQTDFFRTDWKGGEFLGPRGGRSVRHTGRHCSGRSSSGLRLLVHAGQGGVDSTGEDLLGSLQSPQGNRSRGNWATCLGTGGQI